MMRRLSIAAALCILAAVIASTIHDYSASEGLRTTIAACAVAIALTVVFEGQARNAALMLTSLLVGIVVLEAGALFLEKPAPAWIDGGLRKPRKFVGFGPNKAGRYVTKLIAPDGQMIYDVVNTIGDDLLRVTDAAKGDGAIAFFGDSFTFGTGVKDEDTITQAFADLTGRTIPVPNVAFSAWSPAQNLATLQHGIADADLHHARHFVLMTAAWHMERTACNVDYVRGAPRFRLHQGKLVQDGACFEPGGLHWFLRGFAFYRALEPRLYRLTRNDAETYYAIVDDFVRIAKQTYGVDTTILISSYQDGYLEQIGSNEAQYLARLARSGADVMNNPLPYREKGNPYLRLGDGHPNGLANHTLAKLLLEHLQAKNPQVLTASP